MELYGRAEAVVQPTKAALAYAIVSGTDRLSLALQRRYAEIRGHGCGDALRLWPDNQM